MLLLVGIYGLLYSSYVQTKLAQTVTAYLKRTYKLDISIEKVQIEFVKSVSLKKLFVKDLKGDTLLYADNITLDIAAYNLEKQAFFVNNFALNEANFRLTAPSYSAKLNLQEVLDLFSTGDTTTNTSDFKLGIKQVTITNLHFVYAIASDTTKGYGVDYENIELFKFNANLRNFDLLNDSMQADINAIQFAEKSGFKLTKLAGKAVVSGTTVQVHDLQIKTPKSNLKGFYEMHYSQWSDYLDYIHKVKMVAELEASEVHTDDIAFFAPELELWHLPVKISGSGKGKVDKLKTKDLDLKTLKGTLFKGNFDISGLPDFYGSFIGVKANRIETNLSDIKYFIKLFGDTDFNIPDHLKDLGTIAFKGQFDGFPNNFTSYGVVTSALGVLKSDLSLREEKGAYFYKGKLATEILDIGKLADVAELGKLTSSFTIEGSGLSLKDIAADVNGDLKKLDFADYAYKDISLDGRFEPYKFAGFLSSLDSNANFEFNGELDFSEKLPKLNFGAEIYNANLSALHLLSDSLQAQLSASLNINILGVKLSELQGSAFVNDLVYKQRNRTYNLGEFKLMAFSQPQRKLVFESPIANASVEGKFAPEELPASFISLLSEAMPALKAPTNKKLDQQFSFRIDLKDISPLEVFLDEKISVAKGSSISGDYNTKQEVFNVKMYLPAYNYGSFTGQKLNLNLTKNNNVIGADITNEGLIYGDTVYFNNIDILAKAVGNSFQTALQWQNSIFNKGRIEVVGTVKSTTSFELEVLPFDLLLEGDRWVSDKNAQFYYDEQRIAVRDLEIKNGNQLVAIDGRLSKFNEDKLLFTIKEFQLASLKYFLGDSYQIKGKLNGNGYISNPYDELNIEAHINTNELLFKTDTIGSFKFDATWMPSDSTVSIVSTLTRRGEKQNLLIRGSYLPFKKTNNLDAEVIFTEFNLAFLNSFPIDEITDFKGALSGSIKASGELVEPKLYGSLFLYNAGLHINYLNTSYKINDKVIVRPDFIGFNNIKVTDEQGNKASVSGTALHKNFTNWNYDIGVEMNNFLCLNTNATQNKLFYGTAFATGTANISGYTNRLDIEVDATTNKNTKFAIPLGGSEEVYAQEFVRFVNAKENLVVKEETDLFGINLKFNINVTDDAELKLIFDEKIGDVISGRGNGRLSLAISPAGEFQMFGRYTISQGDYLFTLRNVINKHFSVQKGGTITWFGNPYEANVDLKAEYNLRTALQNIMSLSDERYKRKESVKCIMNMNGRLLQPNINFEIAVPSGDDLVRGQVAALSNDENELNKQFLSLLVTGGFTPLQNGVRSQETSVSGANSVGSNGLELLSNQLNNWLSGSFKNFDVGVNIKNGDQLNSGELMVSLARQFFDSRVTLTTDFGTTSRSLAQQSTGGNNNFVGNFVADYSLSEDGRFKIKAFRQATDNFYLSNSLSPYTQGVGLFYQEQFDSFKELRTNFGTLFKRKRKTKK